MGDLNAIFHEALIEGLTVLKTSFVVSNIDSSRLCQQ
jgi:hypothetical protein